MHASQKLLIQFWKVLGRLSLNLRQHWSIFGQRRTRQSLGQKIKVQGHGGIKSAENSPVFTLFVMTE